MRGKDSTLSPARNKMLHRMVGYSILIEIVQLVSYPLLVVQSARIFQYLSMINQIDDHRLCPATRAGRVLPRQSSIVRASLNTMSFHY